jgi:probable rRNA maturation factor
MSFVIEFVTDIPFDLDRKKVSAIAETFGSSAPEAQRGTVNVAFVDDETMRAYNRDYRGIDKTTDVLSFHYFDDFSECGEGEVAGEILLSESRIREQAPEYGNSAEEETYKLLVHSLAHLLGYDHETDEEYEEMRAVEEKIEKELNRR